jgi:hypothetical protein
MKYWEIIADKIAASGWTRGYCSAMTSQEEERGQSSLLTQKVLISVALHIEFAAGEALPSF